MVRPEGYGFYWFKSTMGTSHWALNLHEAGFLSQSFPLANPQRAIIDSGASQLSVPAQMYEAFKLEVLKNR